MATTVLVADNKLIYPNDLFEERPKNIRSQDCLFWFPKQLEGLYVSIEQPETAGYQLCAVRTGGEIEVTPSYLLRDPPQRFIIYRCWKKPPRSIRFLLWHQQRGIQCFIDCATVSYSNRRGALYA
jgi:hypothetical protein